MMKYFRSPNWRLYCQSSIVQLDNPELTGGFWQSSGFLKKQSYVVPLMIMMTTAERYVRWMSGVKINLKLKRVHWRKPKGCHESTSASWWILIWTKEKSIPLYEASNFSKDSHLNSCWIPTSTYLQEDSIRITPNSGHILITSITQSMVDADFISSGSAQLEARFYGEVQ